MNSKTIEYYLQLPYKIEVFPNSDGDGYTAIVPELPGCMTAYTDFSELETLIEEAKHLWLEVAIKHGDPISEPLPKEVKKYSGKFLVRVPKSLHRQLSLRSEIEDTSLNQLVVSMLSESLGRYSVEAHPFRSGKHIGWNLESVQPLSSLVISELARNLYEEEADRFSWKTSMLIPAKLTEVNPI